LIPEREMNKVKNKVESSLMFAEMSILDKSMNLAYFELIGDIELINKEIGNYLRVTAEDIQRLAKKFFLKQIVRVFITDRIERINYGNN